MANSQRIAAGVLAGPTIGLGAEDWDFSPSVPIMASFGGQALGSESYSLVVCHLKPSPFGVTREVVVLGGWVVPFLEDAVDLGFFALLRRHDSGILSLR